MFFNDKLAVSGVRTTRAGYLTAECLAAKGGNIQRYSGHEVGRPDLPTVDVLRPLDEVMSATSLASYAHKPVVVGEHPTNLISSRTWKDHAVGHVGSEVIHDQGMVRVGICVMDQSAIRAIRDQGVTECSAGYECQLEWRDGVSESGKTYQAIQRDIRIDHLAIVPKGRANQDGAGRDCRLLMDAAPRHSSATVDAAKGARDAAYQAMTDHLRNSWMGADAAWPAYGDREAAIKASLHAAEATNERIADGRPDGRADAEAAREQMIAAISKAWRGAA